MKSLVGVDLSGMYEPALKLCLALRFPEQEILLLHSVEPLPEYAPPMYEPVLDTGEWMKHLRAAGEEALAKAQALAGGGSPARGFVVLGPAAGSLMTVADREAVDLIAIGSTRPGPIARLMMGSVARACAVGAKQSLLVTKDDSPAGEATHAIFATDGSPYANQCLDKLLAWRPQGLKRIDVVRTWELAEFTGQLSMIRLAQEHGDSQAALEAQLLGTCEAAAVRIREAGYTSHSFLRQGNPKHELAKAMADTGAQLMVVGAQGHGFLERLFIGSVSLHQIANEPYPVLLVRL